jgi:hypothetical protein
MKKIFLVIVLLSFFLNLSSADATSDAKTKTGKSDELYSLDAFLAQNTGNDVVVNILNSDTDIIGVLTGYSKDGIIVKTFINNIFISKASIAYIKAKNYAGKK